MATRQRRYLATMAFRTLCLVGVWALPGLAAKTAALVIAVVAPLVAVTLANASDPGAPSVTPDAEPGPAPGLSAPDVVSGRADEDGDG